MGQELLDVVIDKSDPTPAYLQLKRQLRHVILSGEVEPGHALWGERDIANRLNLSRVTVRRSMEELAREGLVERRHGSGTFVLPRKVEQVFDRLLGFTEEFGRVGLKPGGRILEVVTSEAPDAIADALMLPGGSNVVQIRRLRTVGGEPLALQTAYLPGRLSPFPVEHLASTGSLYQTLREVFDLVPDNAHQTVSARLPLPEERRLLSIGGSTPVLALARTTSDATGEPFEHVLSAYRGDKYQLGLFLTATSHARGVIASGSGPG